WLAEEGGLLTIWHPGEPEFDATISFDDARTTAGAARAKPIRRLSLDLTAGYYRPPSPREEIADIMQRAFMDLITAEAPPFAQVYDEEIVESVDDVLAEIEKHFAAVADRRPSPMVSWLNYFSPSYATALGTDRLRLIDGLTEEAGGYLWRLTQYPW